MNRKQCLKNWGVGLWLLGALHFTAAGEGVPNYMVSFSYGHVSSTPADYMRGTLLVDEQQVDRMGWGVTLGHKYWVPSLNHNLVDRRDLAVSSNWGMGLVYGLHPASRQPQFFDFSTLTDVKYRNNERSEKFLEDDVVRANYNDFVSLIDHKHDRFKDSGARQGQSVHFWASQFAKNWNVDYVLLNFYVRVFPKRKKVVSHDVREGEASEIYFERSHEYEIGLIVMADETSLYPEAEKDSYEFTKGVKGNTLFIKKTHAGVYSLPRKVDKARAIGFDKNTVLDLLESALTDQLVSLGVEVKKTPDAASAGKRMRVQIK